MANLHKTATATISESPLVLVDVTTSDGDIGHGIVFTYTRAALEPLADLINNIQSMAVGKTLAPLELTANLNRQFRLLAAWRERHYPVIHIRYCSVEPGSPRSCATWYSSRTGWCW